MIIVRAGLVVLALSFAASIGWAMSVEDFGDAFGVIGGMAWGKVSLADLYLGFVLISVFYFVFETKLIALPLTVATFLLGNVVPALWLAVRLPLVLQKSRLAAPTVDTE